MPKWGDRPPVRPKPGIPLHRKRREHEVVDISKTEHPADARVAARVHPPEVVELTNPEHLKIDLNPSPDGIRYDIVNMGGKFEYLVVLYYGEEVFGHRPEKHSGIVPVPDISSRAGKWKGLLIVDDETVADTIEFELDLTIQWLAEELGRVDIRFGDTDGMIDRMGAIRVDPWAKQDATDVSTDREDLAICILFPDLPDRLPTPTPEFTLQIDRPGDGGIYYRDSAPLAEVAGYRMKISGYLPSTEPGSWRVMVLLDDKVLGRTTLRINGAPRAFAPASENPVEEFALNIVG